MATLLLTVGWDAARLVQRIVPQLPASAGLDRLAAGYHAGDLLGSGFSASKTLGVVAHVLIFLPVIVAALNVLAIPAITAPAEHMLDLIVAAIPALFAAALLLLVAYFVGYLAAGLVEHGLAAVGFDRVFARLGLRAEGTPRARRRTPLQVAVVVLAVAIGLQQMGLADQVISLAFGLMLGAVAVAAVIAFGLGGRDAAARQIERWAGNGGSSGGPGSRSKRKASSRSSGGSGTSAT